MKNFVKFWVFSLFLIWLSIVSSNVYAVSYTVDFVTNWGWAISSQTVNEWEKLNISAISVSKEWNTFSGRYTESGFENLFDIENDTVTSDLTLYANWREHRIRVIYHPNWWVNWSNWNPVSDPLPYKSTLWVQYLNYNWNIWGWSNAAPDYISNSSTWWLSKRWYRWHTWWLVWSPDSDLTIPTTIPFSKNRKVAEAIWRLDEFKAWDIEIDLYAWWTLAEYNLTYSWLDDCIFVDGENPTTYTMLSWDITLNNPSKTWYTFMWRSGTDIDWLSTNVVIPSDSVWNRVYEAVWQVNSYSITYDIDWKNKNIVTWDYNSDVARPQDPERNWYKFLWWEPEIPEKMPAENITITAKWEKLGSSWYWSRWSSISNDKNDNDWKDKSDDDKKSEDNSKSDSWDTKQDKNSELKNEGKSDSWKIDLDDLMNVYLWALDNWITTWESLEEALPNGYIKRWEMAKLVVDFSENVLWRTTPSKIPNQCNRWDDEKEWESVETKKYAQKSCALWLMWIYMKNFKPNKLLDRAEFGTIVSRLLRWDKFNKPNATRVNKYYTNHLEEVKKENLITQIDNPEQIKELRKWIWTVLKKIKK